MAAPLQPSRKIQESIMKRMILAGLALGAVLMQDLYAFSVEVEPTVSEISVPAGGSYAGVITVTNVSKDALEITSKIMDWEYESCAGAKKYFPTGTSRYSCSGWITYTPDSFRLEPGQSQEVHYTLTAPAAASGGYFSMALFGAVIPGAKTSNGVTVNIALNMATLFVVEIENTQDVRGSLKELDVVRSAASGPLEVTARFRNEGNVRVNAQGRLSILNTDGSTVGWTRFPDIKTLPQDECTTAAQWDGLGKGHYRLVATFELAPGKLLIREKEINIE